MNRWRNAHERDLFLLYAIFLTATVWLLWLPVRPLTIGFRLQGLVISFHILLLVGRLWRKHPTWVRLWLWALPLSLVMAGVDEILSAETQTLIYPIDTAPLLILTPHAMLGFWVIPVIALLAWGQFWAEKLTYAELIILLTCSALALFGLLDSFATLIPVWYAQNVFMIGSIPLYTVLAKTGAIVLAFHIFYKPQTRRWWQWIGLLLAIQLLYLSLIFGLYLLLN